MQPQQQLTGTYNPFVLLEQNLLTQSCLEKEIYEEFSFFQNLDKEEKTNCTREDSIQNRDRKIKTGVGIVAKVSVRAAQAGLAVVLGKQDMLTSWLGAREFNKIAGRILKHIDKHLDLKTVEKIEKIANDRKERLRNKVVKIDKKIEKKKAKFYSLVNPIAYLELKVESYERHNCLSQCKRIAIRIFAPNHLNNMKAKRQSLYSQKTRHEKYITALTHCKDSFQRILDVNANNASEKKTKPKKSKGFLAKLFNSKPYVTDCW